MVKWLVIFCTILGVGKLNGQNTHQPLSIIMAAGFRQSFPNLNIAASPKSIVGSNYKLGILKPILNGPKIYGGLNINLFHEPINSSGSDLGNFYFTGAEFSKNKINIELEAGSFFNLFNNFWFLKTGLFFGYNSLPNMEGKIISEGAMPPNNNRIYNYSFGRGPEAGFILGNLIAINLSTRSKITFDYDLRFGGIYIKNCTVENNVRVENFSLEGNMFYYTANLGLWYLLK